MTLPHVKKPADLVTSRKATVDGFLTQAAEKNLKAESYLSDARELQAALTISKSIHELVLKVELLDHLLAASGLSDKAKGWLSRAEQRDSVEQLLSRVAESHPEDWRQEILFRFLLTRGDSLGGSMRNHTGASAGESLVNSIVTALGRLRIQPEVTRSDKGKVQALRWSGRLLLFDKKPRFVSKSIDSILLKSADRTTSPQELIERRDCYLACGELKGGIDPAGADEHWKTANSALGRIREIFPGNTVSLFFVGAAIESSMAEEIFAQLGDGRLSFAANATVPAQLASLTDWLVQL
jgi:hypothetical protein